MTIADPRTYLKEFLKERSRGIIKSDFPVDGMRYMCGIGLVDLFSFSQSWQKVIDKLTGDNQQKITLCLARFGSPGVLTAYLLLGNTTGWMK